MDLDELKKNVLFKSVFENSGISIALVDDNSQISDVNVYFCEWLGYTKKEMLSMSFADFTHPDDVDIDLGLYGELIEGKRDYYQLEKKYITKTGEIVWGDLSVSLIRDEKNVPLLGIGMVKDITDNKTKVEALDVKANELQVTLDTLKTIQSVSKIGTWELDLKENKINWSDEVYNIHELEIGTPLKVEDGINFYREDYRDLIQFKINESIEKKSNWDVECVLITNEGNEIWVRATGYPIFENGEVTKLHGLFMDIDESKRNENKLAELNEKLQLSVDAGQIAVWIWNLKTNELEWNEMAYKVYGVDRDVEPTFELFSSMVHPADLKILMQEIDSTLNKGEKFDMVFRFNRPDGEEILLSGRADIVTDSNGKAVQLIGINLDLTEKMRMLEHIKVKENQLRNFVEQAPVAVAMLDNEMKYIVASNQWFWHHSLEVTDITNQSHYDLFPEIRAMPEWLGFHKRVLNGEELSRSKDKFVRADGSVQWISWKLIPWYNTPEEIGGMIIFTADITAEINYTINLEKEVANRTKELMAVNEELESFSYTVSHDLRAPLRSINGFSDILIEDYADKVDENGVRLLNIVKENAIKMGNLIDDILQFSRLGKKSIQAEKIDMDSLINHILSDIDLLYSDKNMEVKIHNTIDVYGDSSLIKQVVTNLLINAYKYTTNESGNCIEINSKYEDDYIVYSIKDNGVGFDMKYHNKIYGVFQRLHVDSNFEGTGVGLAIVRRIINKHKGSIWAESEIGKGSTFYFSLPKNYQNL